MNFDQTPEFSKDLKRLAKKWRSLPTDIEDAKTIIASVYEDTEQKALFQQKFFNNKRATKIIKKGDKEVIKMRLDVESLGSNTVVRIVFIAVITKNTVTLIELFAKNEKAREDKERIKKYL